MFTYLKLFSLVILSLSLTTLVSCTSFHKKLRSAPLGLTKKQALKKFNEPQEKYRTQGKDHWVYETSKSAKDKSQGRIVYKHILIFADGVLINSNFTRSFTNQELKEFYNKH